MTLAVMTNSTAMSPRAASCFLLVAIGLVGCDSNRSGDQVIRRPGEPDYIRGEQEDPELAKACQTARDNVGTFIAALIKPQTTQSSFTVKKPFKDGENTEHIWLTNVSFDGTVFSGTVNNEPVDVKNIRFGDRATVAKDELSDWFFIENSKLVGGYTIRHFFKRMSPEEQAQFRANSSFQID